MLPLLPSGERARLKKGKNELVLALSELGGGWGFVCRLEPLGPAPVATTAGEGAAPTAKSVR